MSSMVLKSNQSAHEKAHAFEKARELTITAEHFCTLNLQCISVSIKCRVGNPIKLQGILFANKLIFI